VALTSGHRELLDFGELNAGQRRMIETVITSRVRITLALGPGGAGKTYATKKLAEAWRKSGPKFRVVVTAWTAAAATVLSKALGPDVCADMDVQPMTVMAMLQHHAQLPITVNQADGPKTLVVVDEACMVPATAPPDSETGVSILGRFLDVFKNCTVLLLGDPDQTGPVSGLSLWQTGTEFRKRLEAQLRPPVVCADGEVRPIQVFANIVWLTEMMRISGKTAFSAEFSEAVTGLSRAAPGARRNLAVLLEQTARRAVPDPTRKHQAKVAAQSRQEVREAMNTIVARHANDGEASLIFRLVDPPPRRRSRDGSPEKQRAVDIPAKGMVRVGANVIRPGALHRARALGCSNSIYTTFNGEVVWCTYISPAETDETVAKAAETMLGIPFRKRVPYSDGIIIKVISTQKNTIAELVNAGGESIEVKPSPNEERNGALDLRLTPVIEGWPEWSTIPKYQGKTIESGTPFVICVRNWELITADQIVMLATRCQSPEDIRWYPRPGPGVITTILSADDPDLLAFKRLTQRHN
jgi:hypothetical protein